MYTNSYILKITNYSKIMHINIYAGNGSKLHDGIKLHEDKFAPSVYFARVTILHGG